MSSLNLQTEAHPRMFLLLGGIIIGTLLLPRELIFPCIMIVIVFVIYLATVNKIDLKLPHQNIQNTNEDHIDLTKLNEINVNPKID